jgi:hypothetical protein
MVKYMQYLSFYKYLLGHPAIIDIGEDDMNITDFEREVEETILARGHGYYRSDAILRLRKKDNGVYIATVHGTDDYAVTAVLDENNVIVNSSCDCPYDMGPICKHQVAVFYKIRDELNDRSEPSFGGSALKNKVKKKKDLRKILSECAKKELVDFLSQLAEEDDAIKTRIEFSFDKSGGDSGIGASVALIRSFIDKYADRTGFIGYRAARHAIEGVDTVLKRAQDALSSGKPLLALDLTLCVAHEMVDLLQSADDSNGEIGGAVTRGIELAGEIAETKKLKSSEREQIFHILMDEAANRRYEGWTDWRLALVGACANLADDSAIREEFEKRLALLIESEKGDEWCRSYVAERINMIRYELICEHDGSEKAQEFIQQNMQYQEFRKMAIDNAICNKDYDLAIHLAHEGEERDQQYPGLVRHWKEERYRAYELSGMLNMKRSLAREFVLDSRFEYYRKLKETYKASEWKSVYPAILAELSGKRDYFKWEIYTSILIEEGEKGKLLDFVKKNPRYVERFHKHLLPDYADEVYDLFIHHIENEAARSSTRGGYRGVCNLIRELKKAGGRKQTEDIKLKLCNTYAKRPAFIEELGKIK